MVKYNTLSKALEFVSILNRLDIKAVTQFTVSFLMNMKCLLSWAGKGCYLKGPLVTNTFFPFKLRKFLTVGVNNRLCICCWLVFLRTHI